MRNNLLLAFVFLLYRKHHVEIYANLAKICPRCAPIRFRVNSLFLNFKLLNFHHQPLYSFVQLLVLLLQTQVLILYSSIVEF